MWVSGPPHSLITHGILHSVSLKQPHTPSTPPHFHTSTPGLTPYNAPGAFSLLAATELTDGVWYPLGGFQGVRDSLRSIAEALGVCIRTGARVAAIDTAAGGAGGCGGGDGGSLAVTGVMLEGGERLVADVVVANRCGAAVGWGWVGGSGCALLARNCPHWLTGAWSRCFAFPFNSAVSALIPSSDCALGICAFVAMWPPCTPTPIYMQGPASVLRPAPGCW